MLYTPAHYQTLSFALRGLWRDWRAGDLRLLALALILAVMAVSTVALFTDRVQQVLYHQGSGWLAADLVIESPDSVSETLIQAAQQRGLQYARTLSFPSTARTHGPAQLVQVKAVSAMYPLRGQLLLQATPTATPIPVIGAPAPGHIWVEPRLLTLLQTQLGEHLILGNQTFVLERLIAQEPDRGGDLFQIAPRILLNLSDVPATGLITPASRVNYRLLLAGAATPLAEFRAWASQLLPPNVEWLGLDTARPELRSVLDRGAQFLALAAWIAVLVNGAAIALASRRWVERQADTIAILRCLGASRRLLRQALWLHLGILVLITGGIGVLLGTLAQNVLEQLVGTWFTPDLPPPRLQSWLMGMATSALSLLGFALPALLRLPQVSPLRVLRRDLGAQSPTAWLTAGAAFGSLAALLYIQAGDARLAGWVLSGVLALIAALAVLGWLLIVLAGILRQHVTGLSRVALAGLNRQPGATLLQVGGFGLGMMALLLLAGVRIELLTAWEQSLPPQTPNHFLINLLPEQVPALENFFIARSLTYSGLHPMIRGRLTHLNATLVIPEAYTNPRAQRLATREFNLSFDTALQADNHIVAGQFWEDSSAPPQLSMEIGIAETLGIQLGDRLTFWIAGREVSAPVTSLRTVRWDSFNVNFFVIGTPSLLREEAATYVTSVYLAPQQEAQLLELTHQFPNVTILDVTAVLTQARKVISQGSYAVEYVFLFTLLAGLLVLFAGIQAGAHGRQRDMALLRVLGVARRQILLIVALEFGVLGLLEGILACIGADLASELLARQVLDLHYHLSLWLWLIGLGSASGIICVAGLFAVWPLIQRAPMASLNRGA